MTEETKYAVPAEAGDNYTETTAQAITPQEGEPTPARMLDKAIASGATPEAIEKLVSLYERLKASHAREQFVLALSAFQADCPIINKGAKVLNKDKRSTRYRYAPLEDIVRGVKHLLHKHGFSYTMDSSYDVDARLMTATCTLTHVAGHSQTSTFVAPIDPDSYMTSPQRYASAHTFAKRYAFCNGTGILTGDADDDAQTADKPAAATKEKTTTTKKAAKPKGDHEKAMEACKKKAADLKKFIVSQGINPKDATQTAGDLSKRSKTKVCGDESMKLTDLTIDQLNEVRELLDKHLTELEEGEK